MAILFGRYAQLGLIPGYTDFHPHFTKEFLMARSFPETKSPIGPPNGDKIPTTPKPQPQPTK